MAGARIMDERIVLARTESQDASSMQDSGVSVSDFEPNMSRKHSGNVRQFPKPRLPGQKSVDIDINRPHPMELLQKRHSKPELFAQSDTAPFNLSACGILQPTKVMADPTCNKPRSSSNYAPFSLAAPLNTFTVMYMGVSTIDRRYPQSVMPWVMAEIRRQEEFREIMLEIHPYTLNGVSCDGRNQLLFEHRLKCLNRFACCRNNPCCFGYLTRQQMNNNFDCHVFMALSEVVVQELFNAIRNATKEATARETNHAAATGDLIDMGDNADIGIEGKAFYEVLYVGRAKIGAKKLTSSDIDDIVDKIHAKDLLKQRSCLEEEEKRKRHVSNASVKSLPTNLENSVCVTENELHEQHVRLRGAGSVESQDSSSQEEVVHNDAIGSSSEQLIQISGKSSPLNFHDKVANLSIDSADTDLHGPNVNLSNSNSSGEIVDGHGTCIGRTEGNVSVVKDAQVLPPRHAPVHMKEELNRTMLLKLGMNNIALISPDTKAAIMERNFTDISFVSQGSKKHDVFGFVTRETTGPFTCYILRCHSEAVVDEIMTALRCAFLSAFEKNKLQICQLCPLHQLHKLCQDIEGLSPQQSYELVMQRVHNLPEQDCEEILAYSKQENPITYNDMLEVLMIKLRRVCHEKQKDHVHISESQKNNKQEFNLMEVKGRSSKFDNFRNKARKSLTNSFDNLLRGRKKDEARLAFRERSNTSDSDMKSIDSSAATSPESSPGHSPVCKNTHFDFPDSPQATPSLPRTNYRPRSCTVGSIPDSLRQNSPREQNPFLEHRLDRKDSLLTGSDNTDGAEEGQRTRRLSGNSPMKQMFLMSSTGGVPPADSSSSGAGSGSGPDKKPPLLRAQSTIDELLSLNAARGRGSWRQAIFNRVVYPGARTPISTIKDEGEVDEEEQKQRSQALRALWRKAILETLFRIRMEKEKLHLKARQDEFHTKRQKLCYREITPGNMAEILKNWDDILENNDPKNMQLSSSKLEQAVRLGVPRTKRGEIWQLLLHQQRSLGDRGIGHDEYSGENTCQSYENLLKQLTTQQHSILIDLGRTFPGHPYFHTQLGPGQLALFNLLKAYSLLDKEVGYCQGLSFVAGILLMHMEEEAAFDMMRFLMFNLALRRQYRPDMIALQIKLYQLTRLIHDKHKDLYDHFEQHEIVPTLYAASWFLTLFSSQFPLGFVARVFDLIFLQGVDVVFKVALVLLGEHKELIKQYDSFETIVEFLKTTLPEMGIIQMERIINRVFEMDISKQLQAYEVEYHVLQEEMMTSPTINNDDTFVRIEEAYRNLKRQNMELLEKLQVANSQKLSLESMISSHQINISKMKSRVETLEIERTALLNTIAKIRTVVPEKTFIELGISIPSVSDPESDQQSLVMFPSSRESSHSRERSSRSPSHRTHSPSPMCHTAQRNGTAGNSLSARDKVAATKSGYKLLKSEYSHLNSTSNT